MKHKKTFCKALACAIALTLLSPASFAPIKVYATDFSDISGHWAEKYINSAISKGIVKGYSDGAFKPDKPVTRAEFASMMNKALGNIGTTSISFTDVPSSRWYYSDISKAVAAAYVSGYDVNSFRPDSPITREEAAVMISRIVPSYGTSGNLRAFEDYDSISNWALTGMQKSNGKGYIGAYNDGNLHPKDKLTRAQTAKIICDITDKETIVTDTPSVKTNGTTLSEKIYSNGVIIHKDLAENSATIDNCVVMGDLSIQGGGSNSVVIYNSRIADCSVAKTGSSVRVVAKGETSILNTDVSNIARLETSNLTGGDSGIGFSSINANGSSALTLAGSFPRINLAGSDSSVKLESGTITTLDVSSSSRNSDITADSNGTISTANVNSVAAFHGTGAIRTLNANANNITYEKKPFDINIGSGVTVKPEETSAVFSITYDPSNEEKNVAINKKITITLSQAITKYNGTDISNSDIKALIGFTKDSKSGTAVAFSATISSSKKVITIIPDDNLTTGVKYYITINSNVFKDANGNGNAAQSVCFTAGPGTVNGVVFNPSNDATGVSASIDPTITFDNAIEKYSGGDITVSYLKSSIDFRLNSSSGSKVSFTPAINSKSKVITITPDSSLTSGQKYHLGFDSKVFQTASDDKSIIAQYVTWTVGGATTPTISFNPANGASEINASTNLFITFSDKMFNSAGSVPNNLNVTSAVTIRDNTAGSNISFKPLISDNSSNTVFMLSPFYKLTAGHNYTVSVNSNSFKNSDGNYAAAESTSFTVITNVDVMTLNTAITRANNAKTDIVTSKDGSDVHTTVYWVTSAQMAALDNAISIATGALSTAQTKAAVDAAATALDNATTTFIQAKTLGTKSTVDTSEIDRSIRNAESQKIGIVVSENGADVDPSKQWVTSEQMKALNEAIAKAKDKKATVKTSDEVTAVVLELNWAAVKHFDLIKSYGTKGIVDKAELAGAINKANNLKEATEVSDSGANIPVGQYWAPLTEISAFTSDIFKAESVLKKDSATQAEVANAVDAISDAIDYFNQHVRKKGSKTVE